MGPVVVELLRVWPKEQNNVPIINPKMFLYIINKLNDKNESYSQLLLVDIFNIRVFTLV